MNIFVIHVNPSPNNPVMSILENSLSSLEKSDSTRVSSQTGIESLWLIKLPRRNLYLSQRLCINHIIATTKAQQVKKKHY